MVFVAGEARSVDNPTPGYFSMRLVKKGPEISAKIDFVDGLWIATINGVVVGSPTADPAESEAVIKIWTHGRMIDDAGYRFLLFRHEWYLKNQPEHPYANPEKPIDLRLMRAIGE